MAGPDMSPLIDKLVFGGVVVAVVSIAGAIAVALIARSGAGQFLSMMAGRIEDAERESRYKKRHAREKANNDYRAWKKRRGY